MKRKLVLLNSSGVFAILCAWLLLSNVLFAAELPGSGNDVPGAGQQQALNNQVDAIEGYIDDIMRSLSGQKQPTNVPSKIPVEKSIPETRSASEAKLIEKRMEAAKKSLGSIASYLATKTKKTGGQKAVPAGITGPNDENCHWTRECVYLTCCRLGPAPENPGTNSCLDQCCRTWENRLICN